MPTSRKKRTKETDGFTAMSPSDCPKIRFIDKIEVHGGSLSHHHGVGKMIGPWMKQHLGEQQMNVLKAIKNHFDPNGIMNPGGTLGFK